MGELTKCFFLLAARAFCDTGRMVLGMGSTCGAELDSMEPGLWDICQSWTSFRSSAGRAGRLGLGVVGQGIIGN